MNSNKLFSIRSELTLAHQQVQMGHDDHREEIIELQNQSQLIEAENNELKKKVTLYEEEFRKVKLIWIKNDVLCDLVPVGRSRPRETGGYPILDYLFFYFSAIFLDQHTQKTRQSKMYKSRMVRKWMVLLSQNLQWEKVVSTRSNRSLWKTVLLSGQFKKF